MNEKLFNLTEANKDRDEKCSLEPVYEQLQIIETQEEKEELRLVESKPKLTREEKVLKARQTYWYKEHLSRMNFSVKDVRLAKSLDNLLKAYDYHLNNTSTYELDKNILRLELRELVRDQNKRLSHYLEQYIPSFYNYTHRYLCPDEALRHLNVNNKDALEFKEAKAVQIFNSIGNQALFKKVSNKVKIEILKQNQKSQAVNIKKAHYMSLYDFLPNQFLIARSWVVKSFCDQLEESSNKDFEYNLRLFEHLNSQARHALIHPSSSLVNTSYTDLFIAEKTQPIKKAQEYFLNWDKEQTAPF